MQPKRNNLVTVAILALLVALNAIQSYQPQHLASSCEARLEPAELPIGIGKNDWIELIQNDHIFIRSIAPIDQTIP